MNKVDYFDADEGNRAVDFFRKVVGELVGSDGHDPVFRVSARQGLQGKLNQDEALWQVSGLHEVETRLLDFMSREKDQTLQVALARKTLDVAADAMMRIRLQCCSLQMPLHDLESRIQILGEKIKEAERDRIGIGDLLAGDRKRTVEFLEIRAEEARNRARGHLKGFIADALQGSESPSVMENKVAGSLCGRNSCLL
jgi:hypothetical protein